MSIDYMKQISDAESEAVSVRKRAVTDARAIADQGRRQVEEILDQARGDADQKYQQVIRQAEAEAETAYQKRLQEVAEECDAMKAQAEKNLPEAVKVIIGKVVG